MTIFKKSLAILLAFAMIFSTMSVMASAEEDVKLSKYPPQLNPDGTIGTDLGNNGIDIIYKFYRAVVEDGKTTWVETKNAAPNELVKMRAFVGTDFTTWSFQLATLFDNNFFTLCDANGNALSEGTHNVDVNTNYSTGVKLTGSNGLAYKFDATTYTHLTRPYSFFTASLPQLDANGNQVKDAEDNVVEVPMLEKSFFSDKHMITLMINFSTNPAPLTINDWCFELYFRVNSGDKYSYVTEKVEDENGELAPRLGYSRAALEVANQPKVAAKRVQGYIQFGKGATGATYNDLTYMTEFDAYVQQTPALLSTYGDVVLDADKEAGGYFSTGEGDVETVVGSQGVINTSVSKAECDANVAKNVHGKTFAGWSKTKGGEVLTATDFIDIKYQHEDITLYAVWKDVETNTTYTYEMYEMLPNGEWPENPATENIDAVIGETVNIPTIAPKGFYLDETKDNITSAVVNADGSTVLRVYFARNKHTAYYHFEDLSGPQTDEIELYYEETIPAFSAVPGGPAKEGHTFKNWSTSEAENIVAPTTMPDGDIHMYPVFEINKYTYLFDADGGKFDNDKSYKSIIYTYGDTPAEFKEIPVKEGYTFSCWDNDMPATVTGDLTFTALYNVNSYTVTFVDDGKVIDSYKVEHGNKVEIADIPEGYKADEWKLDNNTGASFPFIVTENVTFTATDAANMYDATYLVDGKVYEVISHEYGAAIVTPDEDPTKFGHKFVGWLPETEDQIMDSEGKTFDAQFVKGDYTLTIDATGGEFEDGSAEVEITDTYGDNISDKLPENPTKVGHTFAGWSEPLPTEMPGEDTTITAKWTENSYTVKFVNGLNDSTILSVTGVYGSAVTVPELPNVNGYSFEWDVTPPTTIPAYDENGALMANGGTITVTAVPTANEVTITFNTNGGVPESIGAVTGSYGQPIDPAITNPTKEGYEFAGWQTPDGDIIDEITTFPEESVDLKATWTKKSYVAVFNANGGKFENGDATVIETVPYGEDIPVPKDPTMDKYTFVKWDTVPGKMPAKNITFTAVWEAVPAGEVDYTVTVYPVNPSNGEYLDPIVVTGSAAPGTKVEVVADSEKAADDTDIVIDYEDLYPAPSNVPDTTNTKNTADANGDRAVVLAEGAENNITVYLKLNSYDVVFDANGGSFANGNKIIQNVTHGQAATAPTEAPTKEDSIFKGWDAEIPTEVTGPVTLKAVWETKTYEIDFTINGESYKKVTFNYGDPIVAPAYTAKEGYSFSGWDTDGLVANDNAPKSIDAKETAIDYKVSYVALTGVPAGADIPESTTATIGTVITPAAATVPTGYEFDGWYVITDEGKVKVDPSYTMTAADVIFVGEFKALEYNIVFDVDGGNALENKKVAFGTSVDSLPTPSKSGYTFTGWVDENGEAVVLPFDMPASDVKVKATWSEDVVSYTVKYVYNITPDGAAALPADSKLDTGSPIAIETNPEDTDEYKFTGWYYEGNLVTSESVLTMPNHDITILGVWEEKATPKAELVIDANGGKFSNGDEEIKSEREVGSSLNDVVAQPTRDGYTFTGWDKQIPSTMPAEGLTLTAQWEVETYNVVFDTDGGSPVPSTTVTYGGKLEAPATEPTKPGYTFAGWDTTLPIDPMTDIGDDGDTITITAKWDINKNDITIDTDGGKFPGSANEDFTANDVEYGTPLADVLPENRIPVKEGYTFSHWEDANGNRYTFPSTMPDGAIDVKAVYTPNEGTVAYKYDGEIPATAEEVPGSQTYNYNDPVTVAPYPAAVEGYTFDGWYVGTEKYDAGKTFAMPNGSIEFVGHWTKDPVEAEYTITFNAAGGMFDGDETKTTVTLTLKEGDAVTAPADPTREGFVFGGWTPGVPATMPAENISVSAIWNTTDTRHTLTVDANGGEFLDGTDVKTYKYNNGDTPMVEEPTRDGYEFAGWTPELPGGVMPDNDATIKAQWNAVVTVDPNGGKFADGSTAVYETSGAAGDALDTSALVPVTKDNANFLGWKNMTTNETVATLPTTVPAEPVKFVAQWDDLEEHTITFTVLGAEYDSKLIVEGAAIELPADDPVVPGFDFEGWVLADGSEIPTNMGTVDLVAIAVLTPHENSVTYYLDDAKTEVYQTYEGVKYGSEVPVPTDPTKEGYIFAGWSPEVTDSMPDEALEYVATWIEVTESFTVTYLIEEGKTYKVYTVEEGAEVPVPVLNPVKFGYMFAGWEPAIPETMPSEDLEFVAQWEEIDNFTTIIIGGAIIGTGAIIGIGSAATTGAIITGASIIGGVLILWGASELIKNTYTVTYIVDGETYKTFKVLAGTKIPVPADPAKDGYEFAGWDPEIPEKMPAEDLTFEAEWTGVSGDGIIDDEIPNTGSATGIAALAVISAASATAYIVARKKKEEDEE